MCSSDWSLGWGNQSYSIGDFAFLAGGGDEEEEEEEERGGKEGWYIYFLHYTILSSIS